MDWREYNKDTDREALHRIWHEAGWLELDGPGHAVAVSAMAESGNAWCALINSEPECIVTTSPGTINYLGEPLMLSGLSSVVTGRLGRKKGFARDLTAIAVAQDAAAGAQVCALSMFDQGFYNRLGFGNGAYEHRLSVDPARLNVPTSVPTPCRLSAADLVDIHASRKNRWQGHGAITFSGTGMTLTHLVRFPNPFGLGYRDETGAITHMVWMHTPAVGPGPYTVHFMTWQAPHQFKELLSLIKQMGDQVRLVNILEPAGIQLQDLMVQPFRAMRTTHGSEFENQLMALSINQYRICDLAGCLAKTHLNCPTFRFNLKLSDPIESCLDFDQTWRGIAGDYVITLGPECSAHAGEVPGLLQIECTVGAFTRMWLGVRPASGLAITDALVGHGEVIAQLDDAFRLPTPLPDWDF